MDKSSKQYLSPNSSGFIITNSAGFAHPLKGRQNLRVLDPVSRQHKIPVAPIISELA
jgi:hypothetical protein